MMSNPFPSQNVLLFQSSLLLEEYKHGAALENHKEGVLVVVSSMEILKKNSITHTIYKFLVISNSLPSCSTSTSFTKIGLAVVNLETRNFGGIVNDESTLGGCSEMRFE